MAVRWSVFGVDSNRPASWAGCYAMGLARLNLDKMPIEGSAVRYRVFWKLREKAGRAWEADALPTELFPLWVASQAFEQEIFQISTTVNNGSDHHDVFANPIHDAMGLDGKFSPRPSAR